MSLRILMLLENNAYVKDVRVRNEANSLVAAGYTVTVICPRLKDEPSREDVNGVLVYRYPQPPAGNGLIGYLVEYGYALIASFWLSLVVLFRHGFDVIHAHNPPDVFVLMALPYKLLGKRFVFDHHDLSPELYFYSRFGGEGKKIVYKALIFFEVLSCKVANAVIATNESYKAVQIERAKISPDKIFIVRNGPNMAEMEVTPPPPNPKPVIGYLGIIGFQDGADMLVKALAHLTQEMGRDDFTCVVAGSGDALDSVKELADSLGVSQHIDFMGWVDYRKVPQLLASFDICVAPEISNIYADRSTVIKIMEYMAFGKPIVAFDLPEHRRSAGDAALYATDNDPIQFANLLAQLLDDPALRESMGAIGRERIASHLAWSHQAKELLRLYEGLSKR